jgi:hypothetical protein
MLREERDPAWWQRIADHPAVAPTIYLMGERFEFGALLPLVTPLAAMHGGFWFHGDGEPELHAMFLPGHSAEVNAALKLAYEEMICRGAKGFRVSEVEGLKTSRPPKSHGWRVAGGFAAGPLGLSLKPWTLSVAAWRSSPAYKRMA